MIKDIEKLDKLIEGRIEPHIYAFSTNTIPNYLKVGDTYRSVSVRLNEWRRYFPDLKEEYKNKAIVNDEVFFRDYAIHQFLENDLKKHRLEQNEIENIYYSNEFFKDVTPDELEAAISDIKDNFDTNTGKYQYYNSLDNLPTTFTYESTGYWELRPNQDETVKRFREAVTEGRKNLLMYAVMRFGKSFTSLCCAKEIDAKIVLIVSAKADVREEWKKTVQQAENFNKDYVFISSEELLRDENIVKNTLLNGKGVIIFLTLQDLQGQKIKDKHKEIFDNNIDLLIIDETHYGARADKYGEVLKDATYQKDIIQNFSENDFIEIKEADQIMKTLNANIKLHLSGTPYRILMGSEFEKEDIIAFYQFTDIVEDKEKWDFENVLKDEVKEWDNPYYGFPQMVRFAFNPSKRAKEKLEELKSTGNTYAFSSLLKPQSIKKDINGLHKKFINEEEVLDLFMVIDGNKEDNELLGFIDYDKIKEGNMCRHVVCVLPYCASCDALESLLINKKVKFKNLQNYNIINISGVDASTNYKSITDIKNKIKEYEVNGEKTLTLTVNRMLTGSTVEEWDTMIFLKDTASPQEYDQAIFRLQNQYIKTFENENNEIIKHNMKPQTLLVDFDPHRMFSMQEQKSLIYNANVDNGGNQKLNDRIKNELRISPIITMNKDRLVEVKSTDILETVSKYSSDRGVIDESRDIPVDLSLLEIAEIRETISKQSELGSKNGLQLEGYSKDDSGDDLDITNDENNTTEDNIDNSGELTTNNDISIDNDKQKLENKFRMYYSRILFYAFLTNNKVKSLDDIIKSLGDSDNSRIAKNLALEDNIIVEIRNNINLFILSQLDYKIQNINNLSRDENIEPIERALRAINKFGKLSESEVTTPINIASDMVNLLPDESFRNLTKDKTVILDIASKIGEFTIAIYKKIKELEIDLSLVKSSILAIPTSSVAYEFTRKIYTILGLNIDCIAINFNSYDLLNLKNDNSEENEIDYEKINKILKQNKKLSEIKLDEQMEEGEKVEFEAIVGNPPYQISDGGAQASARPIYHNFVEISKIISPKRFSMIMPSRWYSGGKGLDEFRNNMLNDKCIQRLDDFLHPEEIFPNTNNRGGVCYFLWNSEYDNGISNVKINSHIGDGEVVSDFRSMRTKGLDIFIRDNIAISILNKIFVSDDVDIISNYISPRKPFGIESNIIKTDKWNKNQKAFKNPVLCYGKGMQKGYIENNENILHQEWINMWKVYTPRANNIGTELNDDNLNTFIGEPGSICTESYMIIGIDLELDSLASLNLTKYFKTKFVRFLHGITKASQDASRKTYKFVPLQNFKNNSDIDWSKSISEIDNQLYTKYRLDTKEIEHIENKIKVMD